MAASTAIGSSKVDVAEWIEQVAMDPSQLYQLEIPVGLFSDVIFAAVTKNPKVFGYVPKSFENHDKLTLLFYNLVLPDRSITEPEKLPEVIARAPIKLQLYNHLDVFYSNVCGKALIKNPEVILYVNSSCQDYDKLVSSFWERVSSDENTDEDVYQDLIFDVLTKDAWLIQYAPDVIKNNKLYGLFVVNKDGMVLSTLGENCREDLGIVMVACDNNPKAYAFALGKAKAYLKIIDHVLSKDPSMIHFLPKDILDDASQLSTIIQKHPRAKGYLQLSNSTLQVIDCMDFMLDELEPSEDRASYSNGDQNSVYENLLGQAKKYHDSGDAMSLFRLVGEFFQKEKIATEDDDLADDEFDPVDDEPEVEHTTLSSEEEAALLEQNERLRRRSSAMGNALKLLNNPHVQEILKDGAEKGTLAQALVSNPMFHKVIRLMSEEEETPPKEPFPSDLSAIFQDPDGRCRSDDDTGDFNALLPKSPTCQVNKVVPSLNLPLNGQPDIDSSDEETLDDNKDNT